MRFIIFYELPLTNDRTTHTCRTLPVGKRFICCLPEDGPVSVTHRKAQEERIQPLFNKLRICISFGSKSPSKVSRVSCILRHKTLDILENAVNRLKGSQPITPRYARTLGPSREIGVRRNLFTLQKQDNTGRLLETFSQSIFAGVYYLKYLNDIESN